MFESSDDYDFSPSSSSKSRLSSLFDDSVLSSESSRSLKYTAPKQPKGKVDTDLNESKSKSSSSVILAKVVTLWKLQNNDYKSLGKHGLAIIGSTELNLFEIISYKEKNNIVLRRKVGSGYNFFNQKDCFSSFYDNENQNWLVKFENVDDQNAFSIELKNRGATVVKTDSSASTSEKTPVVPKEGIPKPDLFSTESSLPKPEVLPRLTQTIEKDLDEVHSDSSGSQRRANILSRMAKMGQQILPKDIVKNQSTDISDSELDDAKNDHKSAPRKHKRAVPVDKTIPKEEKLQQNYLENQMISAHNANASNPLQFPQNLVGAYPSNVATAYPSTILSPLLLNQAMPYDGFHQYIMSQNTELKMNMAQISAKLDSVLRVGNRSDCKSDDGNLKSKIKTLELRSENLLTDLEKYEKKYDELQAKCKKLEETCRESDGNKSVIENLNKQIEDLQQKLQIAEAKNSSYDKLESDLEKYRTDVIEYKKTIEIQKLKLKDFEIFYEENKDNQSLQNTIDTLNDTVTNLKLKLKDFEEHFLKTEAEKQKHIEENEKTFNVFREKIKTHMNNMYQSILSNFDENKSYSLPEIQSQVAQHLKGTTFSIIKEFQDIYKPNADISSD